MDTNDAMDLTSNRLVAAGLTPQFGTAAGGHDVFTAVLTNTGAQVTAAHQYLDTLVNYQFEIPYGTNYLPLIGPGAQAQVAYGPGGNVARLFYSVPQVAAGPLVQIMSATEASNRAVNLRQRADLPELGLRDLFRRIAHAVDPNQFHKTDQHHPLLRCQRRQHHLQSHRRFERHVGHALGADPGHRRHELRAFGHSLGGHKPERPSCRRRLG